MESEGNRDSGNDSPAEQKGIFSSLELSVNSENLEEIKPELSDENKSRIASAFAQTDATQKHDQLSEQMAEQVAVSGTVIPAGGIGNNSTTSTATGDIRIPGAKKKSKLPLVLAAVVLVAAIGGGVAWFVLGRANTGTSQPETPKEAFTAYKDYLEKGPENLRSNKENSEENECFLFAIANNNIVSEKEPSDYLKELSNKYSNFVTVAGNTAESLEDVNLDQYSRMLTLFIKSASLRELQQGLLDRYLDAGPNSAYNYISEVTPKQPSSHVSQISSGYSSLSDIP